MKKLVLASIAAIIIMIASFSAWFFYNSVDYSEKTKHNTDTWAVIEDSKGDIIAIETTKHSIWDTIINLHNNQTEIWIGGIVEEYDNHWGFRFRPDTTIIAEITIEGAQSTIQGISEDLNYWIITWGKEAYVFSKVIERHE